MAKLDLQRNNEGYLCCEHGVPLCDTIHCAMCEMQESYKRMGRHAMIVGALGLAIIATIVAFVYFGGVV